MSNGDHLSAAELADGLAALPRPSMDDGEVVLVVARPGVGERLTPPRCRLSPEGGLEGDRWVGRGGSGSRGSWDQITVMRADVARLFANGQSLSVFGDNLVVDLDLSTANLPFGARLRVGTALCEVTDKPHTGCAKFSARVGAAARELTGEEEYAALRLRGIYVRVVEAGDVGPGDRVRVVSR